MALNDPSIMPALSADSHIVEPPHCYSRLDRKYRDRAPHVVREENGGDSYVLPGLSQKVPLGIAAAAGIESKKVKYSSVPFEEIHRGAWDGKARIGDQDVDGVFGEIIYPSVGMALCSHPDADYKQAAMWAYNGWLAEEFCAAAPERLHGLGMTAVRSVDEAVDDLARMKEMGFVGATLPGVPATDFPYHDPRFDPFWKASAELGMPISYHILTSGEREGHNPTHDIQTQGNATSDAVKTMLFGNRVLSSMQGLIIQFTFGRIFERNPGLKVVLVEAEAGWAPHYIQRLNHCFERYGHNMGIGDLQYRPGDAFFDNIYMTFQDDRIAWQTAHLMNHRRLLWANDFPHTDATWPRSQSVLREHSVGVAEDVVRRIVRENAAELYGIKLPEAVQAEKPTTA
jgi:predicted TIM-barrel fold metal-dependent hydrolase